MVAAQGPGSTAPTLALPTASPAMVSPFHARLPVPTRLRDRIIRGEFVDFDDLLLDSVGTSFENQVVQLNFGTGSPVEITVDGNNSAEQSHRFGGGAQGHVKRRVHDLATWLEAWTVFARVLTQAAPERASDLLHYQATIIEEYSNYATDACLTYDKRFRTIMSLNPHAVSWTHIDVNLWQSVFTSKGRPPC